MSQGAKVAATFAHPVSSQPPRLTRQSSAEQQQERRQAADAAPARRGSKAATPKASEHADDVRHRSSATTHPAHTRSDHHKATNLCIQELNLLCCPLQFDWEAGIAEDAVEADFGGDEVMADEEHVVEEEEEVDATDDTAGGSVQQDDFAKRMAAFADAFD